MKHKTSELEGALLDAAVALAKGHDIYEEDGWRVSGAGRVLPYSSMWEFGGPIIEREQEPIDNNGAGGLWRAQGVWKSQLKRDGWVCEGSTPLVAAMRCFVASKLGEELELP